MTQGYQLALPDTLWLRLSPALRQAYERAAERVRNPHSENTKRAYERAWMAWAAYCELHGVAPLPVHPRWLIGYLDAQDDKAPNTVRLQLAAIAAIDQGDAAAKNERRLALRRHPVVARWLKSWARDHPEAPRRRARAFRPFELGRVLELAAEPGFNCSRVAHAARFARDKALICVGIACAMRISELCELELHEQKIDEETRSLWVFVRKAKNDQRGRGHERVAFAQKKCCPVEALKQWLRLRGCSPGPVFCPIARNGVLQVGAGLSERQGMRMVSERLRAAGVGFEDASSHSMRATFGTLAKDWPLSAVMAHGGWLSSRAALKYQRQGKLFDERENPTSGLFDG
ncbi:MAG TPA: tyrosine-type recombinase/integrase [Polyangiaceae bacterium]|nr:tyrosine-type recombinase/integrase [Polyangiaceae bacterium]